MTFSNWEIFYFIANYVLAVIAIFGFLASVKTSGRVQKSIEVIQKSMLTYTAPLLKVSNTTWVSHPASQPDSTVQKPENNTPTGILVPYINASKIPVIIEKTDLKVYYGTKLFDEPSQDLWHPQDGTKILAPGEENQMITMQPKLFKEYLGKPQNNSTVPPSFKLRFKDRFFNYGRRKIPIRNKTRGYSKWANHHE